MVLNRPNRRMAMISTSPTTMALPKAWTVRARAQPQDSRTHWEYPVVCNHSSTSGPLHILLCLVRSRLLLATVRHLVQAAEAEDDQHADPRNDGDRHGPELKSDLLLISFRLKRTGRAAVARP